MAGRLIDQPEYKPLIEAVTQQIEPGVNDIMAPYDSKESLTTKVAEDIASDVIDFEWYWNAEDDRTRRIPKDSPVYDNDLVPVVKDIVDAGLEELREYEELPVEPDVDRLVNDLVAYIVTWDKWYPAYKEAQDLLKWSEDRGNDEDIYVDTGYGDPDSSMGLGNVYDSEDQPYPKAYPDVFTPYPDTEISPDNGETVQ